ncbi:MAG: FHA domain-containing protein [Myxococcales bacterium]|nr:FHA domain-containing protein [Myxococcales bacterium]
MGSTPTKEVGAERAQLVLVVGGDVGRSFVVERGGLTLGRASSANARIVAEDISREHARVYPGDDGRYVIEDLESRNGTRVNGVPFSGKRPLELGDRVQLGASVLLIFTRYDAVEAQIERLTRLDSVLQLAGGLAHGFGNVMAVIGGNLAFALSLLDESDEGAPLDRAELREALEDVQTASDQGAKLTRSLSQLTRRQIQRAAQVDMREMASATLELMRPSLGADVELTCDVDDDCRVVGDEQALAQMLTHLCVNAGEAMPRGGHLVVQGRIIDLTRDTRALAPLLARGRYVALSVRDTGIGMDAATRRRALEPFFTTKQGTGLGLALAFSIAREHGGALEIDSAPDKGCRIDVLLPLGSEDMTHGPTADGWRAAPVAATSASTSASTELGTIFDDDSRRRADGQLWPRHRRDDRWPRCRRRARRARSSDARAARRAARGDRAARARHAAGGGTHARARRLRHAAGGARGADDDHRRAGSRRRAAAGQLARGREHRALRAAGLGRHPGGDRNEPRGRGAGDATARARGPRLAARALRRRRRARVCGARARRAGRAAHRGLRAVGWSLGLGVAGGFALGRRLFGGRRRRGSLLGRGFDQASAEQNLGLLLAVDVAFLARHDGETARTLLVDQVVVSLLDELHRSSRKALTTPIRAAPQPLAPGFAVLAAMWHSVRRNE